MKKLLTLIIAILSILTSTSVKAEDYSHLITKCFFDLPFSDIIDEPCNGVQIYSTQADMNWTTIFMNNGTPEILTIMDKETMRVSEVMIYGDGEIRTYEADGQCIFNKDEGTTCNINIIGGSEINTKLGLTSPE